MVKTGEGTGEVCGRISAPQSLAVGQLPQNAARQSVAKRRGVEVWREAAAESCCRLRWWGYFGPWRSRGINSVPAVVVEGKYLISGGQPAETFEQALRQIAGEA